MLKQKLYFALLLLFLAPLAAEVEEGFDKRQITYLLKSKEYSKSFSLYETWHQKLGRHDFEVLQQIAQILLEEGARDSDAEKQLLTIFGVSISATTPSWEILEAGISSRNPQTQVATIQLLGRLQDDQSDELLIRAMSSEFFFSRLEAAYYLALRKHRVVTGQLEALMYRLPEEMRFFFPEFFALIGTSDAISVLRHMMDEKVSMVRIEAILNAGRYGRDDLLAQIRRQATHLNMAEQEACAYALGELKDSKSLPLLQKLSSSPSSNVKLAALRARGQLGDLPVKEEIALIAKERDLFALSTLGDLPEMADEIAPLIHDKDMQVRFNATLALLKQRDRRAALPLTEFLLQDRRDLGFQPHFSLGRSLMAWKVVPSAREHTKQSGFDLVALSLGVREYLLKLALELPEKEFLFLAEQLFDARQNALVPHLVNLLENLHTDAAIALLQEKSQTAGAPLIRAYCNLALFRLRHEGEHEKQLMGWLSQKKESEIIRFRPMATRTSFRLPEAAFELTPEENSRLFIDSLEAIAERHEEKGIDLLLTLILEGNPKNRPLLAGLLLQMIQ